MSHSTHAGFREPPTAVRRFSPPSRPEDPGPPVPSVPSDFVGVGHEVRAETASTSVPPSRAFEGVTSPACEPKLALGVGHIVTKSESVVSAWALDGPDRPAVAFLELRESATVGVGMWTHRPRRPLTGTFLQASAVPSFQSRVVGVGIREEPDAITAVMGADGCSRNAIPFRVIPARGQVREDDVEPAAPERRDVFHEDVARSKLANDAGELEPES
jgi:hypothetical protein